MPLLFGDRDAWEVTFSTDPAEFLRCKADLFVTWKDPIENDQIPTPVWCDEVWTQKFMEDVASGMGALILHAALTDLPREHPLVNKMIRGMFLTHPEQCPVSFVPLAEHPLLAGVEPFVFPENDEHYVIELLPEAETTLLAETRSVNGTQPGLWIHQWGKGRVCCITPGHTTANLTCAPFVRLLRNAAAWCLGE